MGGLMLKVRFSRNLGYVAIAGAALSSAGAYAQTSPLSNPQPVLPYDYPSDRTAANERYRPEYSAEGLRLGGLTVHPELTGGIGYTSNVYGDVNNAASDIYALIRPSLTIDGSGGAERRGYQIALDANLRRYSDEKTANQTALNASASGTLPIGGGGYIALGGGAHRSYESQESSSFPGASIAPIRYDEYIGYLRVSTGGSRLRLIAGIDANDDKFGNGKRADGTLIDQSSRDRLVLRGSARLETSLTGATSAYVEGRYSDINYKRDIIALGLENRDGKQAELLAGFKIDSGKFRGALAAGYTGRTYDFALYRDFGGLAVNGEVTYFATGLSTFTLAAYRNIAESGDPSISGQFNTGASIRVDHELLRYIILTGRVSYDVTSYRGAGRKDKIASVTGGVRYLANRRLEFGGNATYLKRNSNNSLVFGSADFDRFEATATVTGRF